MKLCIAVAIPLRSGQRSYHRARAVLLRLEVAIPLRSGQRSYGRAGRARALPVGRNPFEIRAAFLHGTRTETSWAMRSQSL